MSCLTEVLPGYYCQWTSNGFVSTICDAGYYCTGDSFEKLCPAGQDSSAGASSCHLTTASLIAAIAVPVVVMIIIASVCYYRWKLNRPGTIVATVVTTNVAVPYQNNAQQPYQPYYPPPTQIYANQPYQPLQGGQSFYPQQAQPQNQGYYAQQPYLNQGQPGQGYMAPQLH